MINLRSLGAADRGGLDGTCVQVHAFHDTEFLYLTHL
jgi:hypothetical protein